MADLDVERREVSPWAWILGVAVLAAVVFLLFRLLGERGDPDVAPIGGGVPPPGPPVVTAAPERAPRPAGVDPGEAYPPPVRETMVACTGQPSVDSGLVRHCLERFDGALTALLDRGGVRPEGAREQILSFQQSLQRVVAAPPADPQLPVLAREAFLALASAFAALHDAHPGPEVEAPLRQLREAATAVRPDAPLEEQQEQVRRYLDLAAGMLGATAGQASGTV